MPNCLAMRIVWVSAWTGTAPNASTAAASAAAGQAERNRCTTAVILVVSIATKHGRP